MVEMQKIAILRYRKTKKQKKLMVWKVKIILTLKNSKLTRIEFIPPRP